MHNRIFFVTLLNSFIVFEPQEGQWIGKINLTLFLGLLLISTDKICGITSPALSTVTVSPILISFLINDDQSIYSWRGAEIKNFLEFDQVYKNTKVIRLEQNYRSTQNILSVASNLIANNQNRVGKTLISNMEEGDLIKLNCFKNGKDEAVGISDEIEKNLKKKYSFNQMAILVRAIFQTREFEERFLKIGMPYRMKELNML